MFEYLVKIESVTKNDEDNVIWANTFEAEILARNDGDACRKAREKYCTSYRNPYGELTYNQLVGLYRKIVFRYKWDVPYRKG